MTWLLGNGRGVATPTSKPWARRLYRGLTKGAATLGLVSSALIGLGVVAAQGPAGAANATPVVIGDICSCSGPAASTWAQTTDTMKAWAAWVNAHGGLAGHPIQLVVHDDGFNSAQALAVAQQLVEQDRAVAVLDNSLETTAFESVFTQANIPVLGDVWDAPSHTNQDFYASGTTDNYATVAGLLLLKQLGVKTVAGLYCVEVTTCSAGTALQAKLALNYGLKYVYQAGISFAAPSYTAQCLAAQQAGARAMTVGDATIVVSKVAQNCATQGYRPVMEAPGIVVASQWLDVPAFNGSVGYQGNIPWFVHDSATKTMYAALARYAPQVTEGQNFGQVVVQSWAAGVLLQDAVDAAPAAKDQPITSAVIKNGLYNLPAGETLGGLSPSVIHFVRGEPANFNCFTTMGIKNGKFVWLNSAKPFCAPLKKAGWTPS